MKRKLSNILVAKQSREMKILMKKLKLNSMEMHDFGYRCEGGKTDAVQEFIGSPTRETNK